MKLLLQVLFVFIAIMNQCPALRGERILFLAPICFKSHKNSFMPIAEELAAKGHEVTVITPFQPKLRPRDNIHEIVMGDHLGDELGVDWFAIQAHSPVVAMLSFMENIRKSQTAGYERLMANEEFRTILSERSVDLVVVLSVMNDFTLPIIDHLNVPYVFHSATITVPWILSAMGVDQEYAYIPAFGTEYNSQMTLLQRARNMASIEVFLFVRRLTFLRQMNHFISRDFPNAKSIEDIERGASLLLVGCHPLTQYTRPLPPKVVSVGGLHLRPQQPLPNDLQSFADGAVDGFIVFTLGSVIPVSSMPPHIVQMFVRVFARLPQRIFWKWEKVHFAGDTSDSVKIVEWLPQQDLLGHKNARLFISHGGLLGIQEALFHGVPMLGIPFGNDQRGNLAKGTEEGYALKLEWASLTESSLFNCLHELLHEPRFRANASKFSRLLRDELAPAKDLAVYWIEHVIRHGGAPHLQTRATELPFYQLYLIDVWLLISTIAIFTACVSFKCVFWIVKNARGNKIKAE